MAKAQHAPRYRLVPGLLRKLRQNADLTQRELGEKLQVSHVFVHKSEIGERRVDIAEFSDWCLACGVDPEETFRQLRRQPRTNRLEMTMSEHNHQRFVIYQT